MISDGVRSDGGCDENGDTIEVWEGVSGKFMELERSNWDRSGTPSNGFSWLQSNFDRVNSEAEVGDMNGTLFYRM